MVQIDGSFLAGVAALISSVAALLRVVWLWRRSRPLD